MHPVNSESIVDLLKKIGDIAKFVLFFRHALPLFTSLLNIVCAYDPVGYGVPYNHLMFSDYREPLVETALQVLCVMMENNSNNIGVELPSSPGLDHDSHSEVCI
jgi:hypothetical protein